MIRRDLFDIVVDATALVYHCFQRVISKITTEIRAPQQRPSINDPGVYVSINIPSGKVKTCDVVGDNVSFA